LANRRQVSPGILPSSEPLAVDDLVVADGQDEVLAEGVDEREGQLVVVEAAVDRVHGDVLQAVVHPAHVPLEPEAEAAQVDGRDTLGQAVDSSATVIAPGCSR
jgi:hypothetical protein